MGADPARIAIARDMLAHSASLWPTSPRPNTPPPASPPLDAPTITPQRRVQRRWESPLGSRSPL
jgi:hypothetical protein